MNLFHALLLGVVEGITEFLPVSSTAHLILTGKFLGLAQDEFVGFFEVFIQSGAIFAVLFLYVKYMLSHREIIKNTLLSFIPTAIIGFLLYGVIKSVFFNSELLIVFSMLFVGLLFLLLEYLIAKNRITLKKPLAHMTPVQAILIGLAQSLAVIPGVSRSGIVMAYMMFAGFKRDEAAVYSFILAFPTILMASLYDLYKMRDMLAGAQQNIALIAVGFAASFAVAYAVMRWFIGFLKSNTLVPFALYRIALAIILLVILF